MVEKSAGRKSPGGKSAGQKSAGGKSAGQEPKARQPHYFSAQPQSPSERRRIRVELADVRLDLTTDTEVFSARQLDLGTRILLENAPAPEDGPVLDLGCGYGPVALTLAARDPGTDVWAVDVNERALELVGLNATAAGSSRVRAAKPEDVPADVRFGAIYSNPPIRAGKAVLHEMLLRWLPKLVPGGAAYLVVARNLGSDSLAKWLVAEGFPTERLRSKSGYRVLRARRPDDAG